jgi:hypothetical protein
MRPVRSRQSSIPLKTVVVLGCFLLPVAAVGAIGTLWFMGQIELPFLSRGERIPPGRVRVPYSARPIPAYTKITRDWIMDEHANYKYYYVEPQDVEKGKMLVDIDQIFGRVLKHDKPPGYVFTESDFMPKNTRPGLAAGVPPGRKLVTLDVSKVDGFYGLHAGDHVDLMATFPIEMPKGGGAVGSGRFGSMLQQEATFATMQKRARTRPLAQDAILVTGEHIRQKPTISRSLAQGTMVRNIPVQEIDIAVKPDDVSAINEALTTEVKITATAHSGQPGEDDSLETPGSDPLGEVPVIEAVIGNKSQYLPLMPVQNFSDKTTHNEQHGPGGHHSHGVAFSSRAVNNASGGIQPAQQ